MRIGIVGLLHESNTFIQEKTALKHFEQDVLATGDQVAEIFLGHKHEISGFFEGLSNHKLEAVPLFAARAYPFGIIEGKCFEQLLAMMIDQLNSTSKLDGLLVAPHGATVAENALDADGVWLEEIRQNIGSSIPIIGTLDAHANLSLPMVESTDALIAYRTNPHVDQWQRGMEAADLMAKTLAGEVKPIQHARFPHIAINIERQMTSDNPLKTIYRVADQQLEDQQVLSNSILLGFPYADVKEMGSSVLVVADGNKELACRKANELADLIWNRRSEFDAELISIQQAIEMAQDYEKPVGLLDMGDNVGGGSPGDSTFLLHALSHWSPRLKTLACVNDPETVQIVLQSGVGSKMNLSIGGKTDRLHGEPLQGQFQFLSQHVGTFAEPDVTHGGFSQYDQGVSVVVQSMDGAMTLLITSRRIPPFSINQYLSCGLDPGRFDLVIAKGVNAPIRSYARYCKHFIKVNTEGCTTAEMQSLNYQRRPIPLYPFERLGKS